MLWGDEFSDHWNVLANVVIFLANEIGNGKSVEKSVDYSNVVLPNENVLTNGNGFCANGHSDDGTTVPSV